MNAPVLIGAKPVAVLPRIQYFKRLVYGRAMLYPANEPARVLAAIAGTKTLNQQTLDQAQQLGLIVERVPDPEF